MLIWEVHLMFVFGWTLWKKSLLVSGILFHKYDWRLLISPAILASLKQFHQEATSVLYDEAVATDPAGSIRLSVQWWLWGPSSGTAETLGHSGAGDGGGRGEEVVAVCRYQYEQWKRGGHLHNKAINGILNHKTVILPDPEIKREREQEQKTEWQRERNSKEKGREKTERAYISNYMLPGSIICPLQLKYTLITAQNTKKRFYKSGCNFSKGGLSDGACKKHL